MTQESLIGKTLRDKIHTEICQIEENITSKKKNFNNEKYHKFSLEDGQFLTNFSKWDSFLHTILRQKYPCMTW